MMNAQNHFRAIKSESPAEANLNSSLAHRLNHSFVLVSCQQRWARVVQPMALCPWYQRTQSKHHQPFYVERRFAIAVLRLVRNGCAKIDLRYCGYCLNIHFTRELWHYSSPASLLIWVNCSQGSQATRSVRQHSDAGLINLLIPSGVGNGHSGPIIMCCHRSRCPHL